MNARWNFRAVQFLPIISILAFAAFLFCATPTNGDFWWFDAPRHAMNGVFLRDLIMEGGLLRPLAFANAYYEQYPAINIGFYPPFLYLSSVPFLIVFGVDHSVSQAVVTGYLGLAGLAVYAICIRTSHRTVATAAAICVMGLPEIALWGSQVQLDVPALALLLWLTYFLLRYMDRMEHQWMWAVAICLGLSILTRIQVLFAALPASGLLLFYYRRGFEPPALKYRIAALVVAVAIAAPTFFMALYFSQVNQSLATKMPNMPPLLSTENWTWYLEALPAQLGPWGLCLVILGSIASAWHVIARRRAEKDLILLSAMCLSSWIFFTVVSNKEPRFNLPSLPFLVLIAVWGLERCNIRLARILMTLAGGLIAYHAVLASDLPKVTGFREAATLAQQRTQFGMNVLISAHRDGSFIHSMRTTGDRKDIGIRRADKMFVDIKIMRQLGIRDRDLNVAAIEKMLYEEHVTTIVAQEEYLSDQPSMQNFAGLLKSGQNFVKVATIPITGATRKDENTLSIYIRRTKD